MKKILIAIVLFQTFIANAQTSSEPHNKDTISTWEIGIDLLWLIDKNQVPATSIFGRYSYNYKSNKSNAIRFRLGLNNRPKYDSIQIDEPRPSTRITGNTYIQFGYEWQNQISSGTTVFWGADLYVNYLREEFETLIYPSNVSIALLQGYYKTWNVGAMGFIGIKYSPKNWIAFSLESSIRVNYRARRDKSKVTDVDFPDADGSQSSIDINDFTYEILPITVVNICIMINKKR